MRRAPLVNGERESRWSIMRMLDYPPDPRPALAVRRSILAESREALALYESVIGERPDTRPGSDRSLFGPRWG